ncbi:MAG: STAS/SEC14 domain-containing protein [Planctomycetales bacterium]|nr:STAS/SEC14 domain-containing protein [Planctomycetales bacterium]
MSVSVTESYDGKLVSVEASDKLHRDDYQQFVPELERQIARHGKIRVLFDMHDFHGWQAAALWEDVKFDMKHFKDIERVAFIGDKTWERWMATFCRPFTTATIRYFDHGEKDAAQSWIAQGLPPANPSSRTETAAMPHQQHV